MDQVGPPPPPPPLSLDRIVRAGIGIADSYGLDALSMRRVAAALDAGVMSLYRHLSGRAELVDLMVETVFGELDYPDPGPDGWRARLELSARQEWAMYQRHPWVLSRVAGTHRPPLGPNVLANAEWLLRAVDGHGLDARTMFQLYFTVSDYVQGAALYVHGAVEDERRTGTSTEQWWTANAPTLTRLLRTGRFPTLSRLVPEIGGAPGTQIKDFEFGLRRVLDGIGTLLLGTAAAAAGPTEEVTRLPTPPDRPSAPATGTSELLGRRWTPELLQVLGQGEARFGDLVRAVPGISRRVLAERLRQLADEGLLVRRTEPGPPTRISYALTDAARRNAPGPGPGGPGHRRQLR
ncbi:TetR/AcrR family transcriptional regulator C-terminal domain-containing protein [Plantactinospora sonchi]|uniref:TetR/AcrR family transcriptional regulator C-terminal domain-containing protein n=1 Tax=Plantactinospora sonchi TaxID=1544735 RepID=A0ABU7RZ81_9ACTN